jgi:hypothetical protein
VKKDWVVCAKRPFGGPQRALKYLAHYTHRVAISNRRLIELRDGQVSFQYNDYADGNGHYAAASAFARLTADL